MKEIISDIRNRLSLKSNDSYFILNNRKHNIDPKNFLNSGTSTLYSPFGSVSFIDGGSCTILSTSDFCFGLIRIVELKIDNAYYENNDSEKKLKTNKKYKKIYKKDVFVMITIDNELYNIKTYPKTDLENLKININNPEFSYNNERTIENTINFIRRILELEKTLESNSEIVILDGSFDAKNFFEQNIINKIRKRNNINCAISKTSRIITDKGNSINYALISINDANWFYDLKNNENAFIKLNKNSDYVFRLDILNKFNESIKSVMSYLESISNDPVFLGYPYYLIETDKLARISNNEKKALFTKSKILLGSDWKKVKRRLNSTNAHEVLDKIS
ncbi:MAG: hypothetical protein QXG00_08105 [Candidatus Woesearchaeota archaeon]